MLRNNKNKIVSIADLINTIRCCVNTKGEKYLSDRSLFSILFHFKRLTKSRPFGGVVSRDFCGHCGDCKFWNTKNLECKNDIIYLNLPERFTARYLSENEKVFFNISDLKTNINFGCIRFESKSSG